VSAEESAGQETERKESDRRRKDRRSPPPWWRRPWVLVLYGIIGTLIVLGLLNRSRPPQVPIGETEVVTTGPGAPAVAVEGARPVAPPQDARSPADLEQLVAEGEEARGRLVFVELFCSSISQVALRNVDVVSAAVAEVRDVTNRVPAAECKWGQRAEDGPRGDVLLLVPPELATAFANAPVVDDGFVPRRHVVGTVEWVGRSEALALRNVALLRQLNPSPSLGHHSSAPAPRPS
jgi:hypothetical protein